MCKAGIKSYGKTGRRIALLLVFYLVGMRNGVVLQIEPPRDGQGWRDCVPEVGLDDL